MSIRARLALFGAGVVVVAILIFGLLVYLLARAGQGQQADRVLQRRAGAAVVMILKQPVGALGARNAPFPIDLRTSSDTFVEQLDAQGAPLTSTGLVDGAAPEVDAEILRRAALHGDALATLRPRSGVGLRVDVRPWRRTDTGEDGYVVAGQAARVEEGSIQGLRNLLLIAALVSLLAALGAIWFVPGRALKPLQDMAQTADVIGRTRDLSRRLPPATTRDEVSLLTERFNGMLSRLQEAQEQLQEANQRLAQALESQQRFVADASHELRTPLTTIRSNAGFLRRPGEIRPADRAEAIEDIYSEAERMSRLVEGLLTLARADAGQLLDRKPLELGAIVRQIIRQAQHVQPDRRLYLEADGDLPMSGNEDGLKQLLWILVDNAIKHTPEDGQIWVITERLDDLVRMTVADDGEGISAGEFERIFERFYQADPARGHSGAGLGLAIARWIAGQHGGHIRACNNDLGGASFIVELPSNFSSHS